MDILLFITRILIIIAGFSLMFLNFKQIVKVKNEWNWLRILSGIAGALSSSFYLVIVLGLLETSKVMINPFVFMLISVLLCNTIYSEKTRGL